LVDTSYFERIQSTLREHQNWRKSTLNLSAAENVHSPAVDRLLVSDLSQRYADYQGRDPSARKYQGTRYIQEIEALTTELVQKVFHARYIELRGVSGHVTDDAVMLGLATPGGVIVEVGSDPGGHGDGRKLCENALINARIDYFPFDAHNYNIDLPQTIRLMREVRPSLIKLGTSSFLFPHPAAEICEEARRLGNMRVAYDASHVYGLIAGGFFQDPLQEGVDVVMGSTHKTLPGPQGGLILSNDEQVINLVSAAVYPILVSNHHLSRLPAFSMALLETLEFGQKYAAQIIQNAKRLGLEIHRLGIPVVASHKDFTESHTILLQTAPFGDHKTLANLLDQANIIVNASRLPVELGGQGIRIGLQEITRLGATVEDMKIIAGWIVQIIRREKSPAAIAAEVASFRQNFQTVQFCFPEEKAL